MKNSIQKSLRFISHLLNTYILVLLAQTMVFATNGIMTGSGTEADPYLVADYADLKAVGTTYGLNKVYRLIADIDASPSASENGGLGFAPIGTSTTLFTGAFHGAGLVITNLTINRPSTSFVGLFGDSRGTIDSLGLLGVSVRGNNHVGGLVGYSFNTVSICYATGSVTGSGGGVGGLLGYNEGYSSNGLVNGCYATSSVRSTGNMVGGLVGNNYYGTVIGCFATGSVSGNDAVGGLVGKIYTANVTGCYATGSVTGTNAVGGLIGQTNFNYGGSVTGNYTTGSVTGSGNYIGGLIGYNLGWNVGTLSGCYSTGLVTGSGSYVGGLIGYNYNTTVSGCYWDTETSAMANGIGTNSGTASITSLTTVQMKNSSNYSGWNFASTWIICVDSTYPGLRSLDNASFAFADTIVSGRTLTLSKLLLNDCDIETACNNLILHVSSTSTGTTDSVLTLTFVDSIAHGTIATVKYRIGEIRCADTLWGNIATAIITLDTTIVLPVELTSFIANISGHNVELKWQTATEVNNYGFEIERSTENEDWYKIGFIEGHGNSNSPKNYGYVDKNLIGGSKFEYRLKQIDADGKFEYSDVVEIEVLPNEYELYQNFPNPANPSTKIIFSLPYETELRIVLYSILGESMRTITEGKYDAGFYQVELIMSDLPSGVYVYRIESIEFISTKKLMLLK